MKKESYCRYPVYPPSMEHYSEIEVSQTDKIYSILKQCGLANPKEGLVDQMIVTEELKAGQWFYSSRKNENMTPMNPHMFFVRITKYTYM